jgi:coatomer subunit beta
MITSSQTIIRFVMPIDDRILKKLLLSYWEVVPKTNAEGKLLHELILVCDAYRKVCRCGFMARDSLKSVCSSQDLQHHNEFIRGSTLRFLCKLKEPELLEPLMPAIQECLNHRHNYVSQAIREIIIKSSSLQ